MKLDKPGRSANTRKKAISVLRVGLYTAVRDALIVSNPCAAVTKQKVTLRQVSQSVFLRGSNFDRYVWYKIRESAGVPVTVRFHDLRHTQASLMLAAGIDLKVIQKRLGHSSFEITANTYAHLLQEAQANAVVKLGELLDKAKAESAEGQS